MWVRFLGWADPRKRAWQPTPVFLPGESHGRGGWWASPRGHKELDTTEQLSLHMQRLKQGKPLGSKMQGCTYSQMPTYTTLI